MANFVLDAGTVAKAQVMSNYYIIFFPKYYCRCHWCFVMLLDSPTEPHILSFPLNESYLMITWAYEG